MVQDDAIQAFLRIFAAKKGNYSFYSYYIFIVIIAAIAY